MLRAWCAAVLYEWCAAVAELGWSLRAGRMRWACRGMFLSAHKSIRTSTNIQSRALPVHRWHLLLSLQAFYRAELRCLENMERTLKEALTKGQQCCEDGSSAKAVQTRGWWRSLSHYTAISSPCTAISSPCTAASPRCTAISSPCAAVSSLH